MLAAGKALTDAAKAVVDAAGDTAKAELAKTAPIVPGSDLQFSNWKAAGKLKVRVRRERASEGVGIWVVPVGPWGLAQVGAKAHPVNHPGTKQGKQSWSKGRDATYARLKGEIPEGLGDAVEEAFDG